jgi:tetratricopeptide (TPR) repeat protein
MRPSKSSARNGFDQPAHGYFSRHLSWAAFGEYNKALADCSKAIAMSPNPHRYMARADIYRALGDHARALADLNHVHDTDHETWLHSFGPHCRADALARLGRLDEALADAALLRDDHWMPEHDNLPGGDKQVRQCAPVSCSLSLGNSSTKLHGRCR